MIFTQELICPHCGGTAIVNIVFDSDYKDKKTMQGKCQQCEIVIEYTFKYDGEEYEMIRVEDSGRYYIK